MSQFRNISGGQPVSTAVVPATFLIATTALVATAGVAVADVKVSGYARFGAMYSEGSAARAAGATAAADANAVVAAQAAVNAATTTADLKTATTALAAARKAAAASAAVPEVKDSTDTRSRLRLQFDATTETDGGLTLGVRQRFQTEENGANSGGNGARFYASTGGLTIAMGNILGVIEAAPNLYLPTKSAGVGLEGNFFAHLAPSFGTQAAAGLTGAPSWTAYSSGGAGATDGVEVLYSMNGLGLHAHSTDDSYGIGANYKFADYTVAVAYEEFDGGDNILFASVGGKFGAFDAALSYGRGELTSTGGTAWEADKVSLRAGYAASDAMYVYGYVATEDNNVAGVSVDDSYGLGASYALGGGASVEAGWESAGGKNRVSAGVFFSF